MGLYSLYYDTQLAELLAGGCVVHQGLHPGAVHRTGIWVFDRLCRGHPDGGPLVV